LPESSTEMFNIARLDFSIVKIRPPDEGAIAKNPYAFSVFGLWDRSISHTVD
jgi:hypothetical protein